MGPQRDAKALSKPSSQYRKWGFSWPALYGAAFELTAAPTRPITGVVSAVAAKGDYRPTPFTLEEQKLGLGPRYVRIAGIPVEIQNQAHRMLDSEAKREPLKCDLLFQPAEQKTEK